MAEPVTRYAVAEIWRYPVKSMRGERVDAAAVDRFGLAGDRVHAVIDTQTGKVASGAWRARRWADLLDWSATCRTEPDDRHRVPEVGIEAPTGARLRSASSRIDEELTEALGRDVRLATRGLEDDTVMYGDAPPGSFQDVATLHLVTTGTLTRLSELAPETSFDVRRFRPNLVIDTGDEPGFIEEGWIGAHLTFDGGVRLRVTDRCRRCVMTTLGQADLPKDAGVLRAAARSNEATVGVYAEVEVRGTVRVGSTVLPVDSDLSAGD